MRINPPLVALAIGAFGIGVTEFAPMGMLPGIAADLGVSIPAAGLLVSAYALGVLLGAPLMTLTTGKIPRRYLLIGLMAIFTLGNLMSALATDYYSLMIARVVTSLNHGAFFGVGSVVAATLVAPEKRAGAVATMFMGLTLATIGGVPLAAAGRRGHPDLGYCQLRPGAATTDARYGSSEGRAQSGLGGEHRRLQLRQCDWRSAWRRGDQQRAGLSGDLPGWRGNGGPGVADGFGVCVAFQND